jgi:hypothetical protein
MNRTKKTLLALAMICCVAQAPSGIPAPGLCASATMAVTAATSTQVLPGVVTFTGAIAGNVLTTSAVTGTLANGQTVTGSGVPPSTKILKQLTGSAGGAGTYQLTIDTTTIGTITAEAMTGALTTCNILQILNDGTSEVFFVMGGSTVTATVTASGTTVALPAGQTILLAFTVNAPYMAAITGSATSTLRILSLN